MKSTDGKIFLAVKNRAAKDVLQVSVQTWIPAAELKSCDSPVALAEQLRTTSGGRIAIISDFELLKDELPAAGEGCSVLRLQIGGDAVSPLPAAESDAGSRYDIYFCRLPVRLGEVLSRATRFLARADMRDVAIGGVYILTPGENRLARSKPGKGGDIFLTEKECDILLRLNESAGRVVSRHDLLHEIWGYAPGVETHTLETHIYRLRQKIEDSPSEPRIIVTEEAGYRLGAG